MGRVGRVSKVVCMRMLVQFFSFTVGCAPMAFEIQICKKSMAAHVQSRLLVPSMKRLTLTGFTKRGLSRVRCRRRFAKAFDKSHADFVQNRLSLNLRLSCWPIVGKPFLHSTVSQSRLTSSFRQRTPVKSCPRHFTIVALNLLPVPKTVTA